MVGLRHFTAEDAGLLRSVRYSGMSEEEIRAMIDDRNTLEYDGRYFEMYAAVAEGSVTGSVSVYEQSKSTVQIGPDIFSQQRRKGYASEAVEAMKLCAGKGYSAAIQHVRADNTASIAFHENRVSRG